MEEKSNIIRRIKLNLRGTSWILKEGNNTCDNLKFGSKLDDDIPTEFIIFCSDKMMLDKSSFIIENENDEYYIIFKKEKINLILDKNYVALELFWTREDGSSGSYVKEIRNYS